MMRKLAIAAALSFSLTAFAQDDPVRAATDLVDAGKFDEAIAALQKIVAASPADERAVYELGVAYAAKGDNQACVGTLTPVSSAAGPSQIAALSMLANCLDNLGQRDKAIETYRMGLKLDPDDAQLNFNLAVTLASGRQFDEARSLLKHDTLKNPLHASGHLLLARIFEGQGFRIPALCSYLRFLALEPATKRSPFAAGEVQKLLFGNVTKTEKGANVTVDVGESTEEGDYKALSMMISLLSASQLTKDAKKQSEFEKLMAQTTMVIGFVIEHEGKGDDYTASVQVPYFRSMQKEKLLDPFAGVALASLNLPGTAEWSKAHEKDIERVKQWAAPPIVRPRIQLPPPH